MDKIENKHVDMLNKGDRITSESVNIIQDGLNEITRLWGIPSSGSQKVSKEEISKAKVMNTWISWLKQYASRIGASSLVSNIKEIPVGETMIYSKVSEIYTGTQTVKNHCNRSECNSGYECNDDECCNSYECNWDECDRSESNSVECNDAECNSGECNDAECNDGESNGGEW